MNRDMSSKAKLLFMKVGLHAGESFEQIIERKRHEYDDAGMIFWGYGGGTCHPTHAVQPFARMAIEEGIQPLIVMEIIHSHHTPINIVATEYSEDGITWKPIPEGIIVKDSRYALVLDELQAGDLDVDLSTYKIAVGPSMGKDASKYILGQVDKACMELSENSPSGIEKDQRKISFYATIKAPYAVFTR